MSHLDNGQNFNSKKQRHAIIPHKERGVVAVVVALSLVGLVAFIGLALDTGKLFVTKTELQNSADACALAAARELAGANNNQLALAEAAGIAAGSSNNVMFQSDAVSVVGSDVTFSDAFNGSYLTKEGVANALDMKFVRCTVDRTDISNWFMQVLGIGDQNVNATAVASLVPGQTACAIPIAVCESNLATKLKGDWLETALDAGEGITGDFLWASFAGGGAKEIKSYLIGTGECNLPDTGEEIGSPGVISGAYDAWNTRFGAYKGAYNATNAEPDLTGYAYTAKSWPECKNAFEDFKIKRANNTPIQDPTLDTTGLKVVPPANPSLKEVHALGGDRRLVSVPVVDCSGFSGGSHDAEILSWACVLILHPLDQNANADAYNSCSTTGTNTAFLEYLGNADDLLSPCASAGVVGGPGSVGPLVPALVQ